MTRVTRDLTPRTNLESLRKQAKRWLKDIEAGDKFAADRFRDIFPDRADNPKLREVQHALSREYGFANWAALKQEIEDRTLAARDHADRVALFLEKSVLRYGMAPRSKEYSGYEPDRPRRNAFAARLLARHPEIASDSIHTAVAAGDVERVKAFIAADPRQATNGSAFDGWTPLLRLASARLPTEAMEAHAVPIARLLIENGARPGEFWDDGHNHFTTITCAIGGGESSQSAHPRAQELVRLLLDAGGDPLDGQALYNTSLGSDDAFWLDMLWAESEKRGETDKWFTKPRELGLPALDYLLGNAVNQGHAKRVDWLLRHGAKASARNCYSKQPVIKNALLNGRADIAETLARHGAIMPELTESEAFQAAAMRGDQDEVKRRVDEDRTFLRLPGPMMQAIQEGREDLVVMLLRLGVSPDIATPDGVRALHIAAGSGAVDIARMLIERGAEIDPFENRYGGSPLTWAIYNNQPETTALLVRLSRNVRGLCFAGAVERLRELFTENPALVSAPIHEHEPPIFCLPDDDERAVELVELLQSFGADTAVRNAEGLTPAEAARKRGLEDAASLLDGKD